MANSTISGLSATATVGGTDLFETVQGGANKKATGTQVGQIQRNLMTTGVQGSTFEIATNTSYHADQDKTATMSVAFGNLAGVAGGAVLDGGVWSNSGGGPSVQIHTGTGARVQHALIKTTPASVGTGISLNELNTIDTIIHGNLVQADAYGILTNTPGTGIDGLVITANIIESTSADPIELNAPAVVHQNVAIAGNVFAAPNGNGVSSAGFGFGSARTRCVALTGNAFKTSFYECVHIEDEQWATTICGNAGQSIKSAGVILHTMASGLAEGIVVCGNTLKAAAASTSAGMQMVYDGNPCKGSTVVGNRFRDFNRGIDGGHDDFIADGNFIDNSSIAVQQTGGCHIWGQNFARNCTTLFLASSPGSIEAVVSDTVPTTILDVSTQIANDLGNFVEKFAFPPIAANTSLPVGATTFNLFALPNVMRGRVIVTVRDGATTSNAYYSADLIYDGTTLTLDHTLSSVDALSHMTVVNATAVTASGGFLKFTVTNATAAAFTTTSFFVLFKGEYYKHN